MSGSSLQALKASRGALDGLLKTQELVGISEEGNDKPKDTEDEDSTKVDNNYPSLPLDASKREIRILELHPGLFRDEIVFTLTSLIYFKSRNYEALSYT